MECYKESLSFYDFYHDIIECLVGTIEAKDNYTEGHSKRVANLSEDIGNVLNFSDEEQEILHIAAHLHDVGKIGVPDIVLNKSSKLTDSEWLIIKEHPQIGYDILSRSQNLLDIADIVVAHHERWDGKGYPNKLKGIQIPKAARIIAVCDTVDAMTSARPYREAMTWQVCKHELQRNKWKQFDGDIVDAALKVWDKWAKNYLNK